jgi:methyl-accepting chemotaxis protein
MCFLKLGEQILMPITLMFDISSGGGLEHRLKETGNDELTNISISFNEFIRKIN